jgi:SulP family sulfate permease
MADFLAKPVIVGFVHGLAVVIFVGQLPKVLGIKAGGATTIGQLGHVVRSLGQTNASTLIVGGSCVAVILLLRRWAPRVPGMVVVLLGSLAAVHLLGLERSGVAVVGDIPRGLPSFHVPAVSLQDLRDMAPIALASALLAFSDTIVTARSFASRNRYQIDANQELIALGLVNIASSVTQGLPISGSVSCTAVAESTGSRTQLTSVAAAATLASVMLFLTPYLARLPRAALGGILIAAAYTLCDLREFRRLWNFRGVGFFVAMVVLAGVVGIGVMEGIVLGVIASLILVLRALAFPHDSVLGQVEDGFEDIVYRPDARAVPGVIIYRFSGPLFFANGGRFRSRIEGLCQRAAETPKRFVLDASVIFEVDLSACETLIEVGDSLGKQGIRFSIANLRAQVMETLTRGGVTAHLGEDAFFPTIAEAIAGRVNRQTEPRSNPLIGAGI